jgi:hypothetical protein
VAQKVQVLLVDDIDGGEASETVSFALDGTSYEIDLSEGNAKKMRDALAAYVGSARKAARVQGASRAGRSSARPDREQTRAIRTWARSKGLEVNDRGRIPSTVIDQYNKSH